ncbi:MAG: alpha-amylase, partial [Burkholderiaceae bacterium]
LIRRVQAGENPEVEMSHFLDHHGYQNASRLLGEVVRRDAAGTPHTLMLLQQAISNEGDGWNWLTNALARTLDDATLIGLSDAEFREQLEAPETIMAAIGRRLAELHALLAVPESPSAGPLPYDPAAFAPLAVGRARIDAWADATQHRLERALRAIERTADWRSETAQDAARSLLTQHEALLAWPQTLAREVERAMLTRVHGHFHLGQTLISGDDVYLIGFDGDPALPPAERRLLDHPLRDVAGLLRSIDYAAQTARLSGEDKTPGSAMRTRRDQLLDSFQQVMAEAFLRAYFDSRHARPADPRTDAHEPALLELFLLDRAAQEIEQESVNRPTWLEVPIRGLAAMLRKRLEQPPAASANPPDAAKP